MNTACQVKICGITCIEDARLAIDVGAFAIGINLIEASKRFIDFKTAQQIVRSAAGRVATIAVVADRETADLQQLQLELGVDWLQLHGEESPGQVAALGPSAFKAVRIGGAEDVASARAYPGEFLLVDAKVVGTLGGSGKTFDWHLVSELVRERQVIVAGGLRADNVEAAVRLLAPFGVDVASGVERTGDPRRKDPDKVDAFMSAIGRSASG